VAARRSYGLSRWRKGDPIPERAFTYVVVWDGLGVVKVGRCWHIDRIATMGLVETDGRVAFLVEHSLKSVEAEVLRQFWDHPETTQPAFASAAEAAWLLPPDGHGWTETFQFTPGRWLDVRALVFAGIRAARH